MRGSLIDLSWKAPDFDPETRQLVGYELFRDDTSTRPPSRLTWKTMPGANLEARGLEILPHSEYGVQPIWRVRAAEPPHVIEFGPPSLDHEIGGTRQVIVPPEERIRTLAWLQRDGAITSPEMELAIEHLLGGRGKAAPEPEPAPPGALSTAKSKRVLAAYAAAAVLLVLLVTVAGPTAVRILFAHQSAVRVLSSPSPTQPSSSPSPPARVVNLRAILIKPTDLRAGYVAGPYDSSPLCSACVPASSSLFVVLENQKLHHSITTAASVAPSVDDGKSVVRALTKFWSSGKWVSGKGLGDESFQFSNTHGGVSYFYVVWRSGVVTDEIVVAAPQGQLTMQNALDLAKIQQTRTAAAHAG